MRTERLLKKPAWMVMPLLLAVLLSYGQSVLAEVITQSPKAITGVVVDVEGLPVAGVTVSVVDSSNATVTNLQGEYSINASPNDVLSFSSIGYQTHEVPVGVQSVITVVLREASMIIEDVVIVGYGTQKKVSVTGAVANVRMPELQSVPAASFSNTLGGQLPGLIVRQYSGEPGFDGAQLYIRGMATFNNQSPLVLVDGTERDINLVNPQEVESFTILKDASATAVYGVQGANGVIIITTKKGTKGAPKVSYRGEAALVTGMRFPDYIQGYEFATLMNEASANSGNPVAWDDEEIQKFKDGSDPYLYPNVDWTKAVFKKHTWQTVHNLSVTGGAEVARYYISLALTAKDGLYNEDKSKDWKTNGGKFRRYNFRSNIDVNLAKDLVLDLGLGAVLQDRGYQGTSAGAIHTALNQTSPIAYPLFNPDGSVGTGGATGYLLSNPYALATQTGYSQMFVSTLQTNLGINWDLSRHITKGLSIGGRYGFDHYYFNEVFRRVDYEAKQYTGMDENGFDKYTIYREQGQMGYNVSQNSNYRQYLEASINYNRTFGKHGVSGMFLFNRREYKNLTAGSSLYNIPYRYQGIAGRATYSFDDRYLAEFNFGYNGSEQFPKGGRYGFFPSLSLGWVVSNEQFYNSNVLTHLKLRGSAGQVGNDQTSGDRFLYITSLNKDAVGYRFGTSQSYVSGLEELKFGVPLKWEVATKYNIGLDLEFLKFISIQAEVFKERRENILMKRGSIPLYAGLVPHGTPYGNVGIIDNKGLETAFEIRKTTSYGLYYTIRGNFTFARNNIIEDDSALPAEPYQNSRGTKIGQYYGLIAEGLFQTQEEIDNWATSGFQTTIMPGDIKYRDLNKDGVINAEDMTYIGHSVIPEIMYGFGGTLAYKGFDITVHFSGVANRSAMLTGDAMWPFNLDYPAYNVYKEYYDNRWIEGADNSNAKYPTVVAGRNTHNYQNSTLYLRDARYLKLQNAEIGYTLPSAVTARWGIGSLRVFVNGTNLATFDKIKIMDPEMNITDGYPQQRVINVGVQINFK